MSIQIKGATSEPGLNGQYHHNNQSYNGRPQYQKQNTRIYIRYSQERWSGWCLYVSHHPLKPGGEPGTAYFTNNEDVPLPPTNNNWKPSQCCFPNEKLHLSYINNTETKEETLAVAVPTIVTTVTTPSIQIPAPIPAPKITFYTTSTCPFAQQIDIAMKEMQIKNVKRVEVDIFDFPKEEFVAAYEKAYPEAPRRPSVPIVEITSSTSNTTLHLTESSVILQYLTEVFDETHLLMPTAPIERAAIRLFVIASQSFLTACISKILNATRLDSLNVAIVALTRGFTCLNALLAKQDRATTQQEGPFFLGNAMTLAEITIAPHIQRLVLLVPQLRPELLLLLKQKDMLTWIKKRWPRLEHWMQATLSRHSVRASFGAETKVTAVLSKATANWQEQSLFASPIRLTKQQLHHV